MLSVRFQEAAAAEPARTPVVQVDDWSAVSVADQGALHTFDSHPANYTGPKVFSERSSYMLSSRAWDLSSLAQRECTADGCAGRAYIHLAHSCCLLLLSLKSAFHTSRASSAQSKFKHMKHSGKWPARSEADSRARKGPGCRRLKQRS